ncbi:ComEC family competence protein [Polaribacter litorisediminis]|uniref:ComEC/Rec2 family competence protein n=1 Tax=Polaribacter litorisediminis TaxID=1908341 RepID=UPI001CBD5AF7|nr:ComEC/Rec2 family competence protein [Polaribacter litorisediminis]UAM98703.1 ComEC family competence protein [Polaribacter litorisediminis]
MKRLINYVPIHFLLFLILGISTQFYTNFWQFGFVQLFLLLLLFLGLFFLIPNKIVRTLCSFLVFFLIGVSAVFINNKENYKNYYSSYLNSNAQVTLKVTKILKSGMYAHKYEADVIQVDTLKTKGTILLNIFKDSFSSTLKVDEILVTKALFTELNPPLNPHQFNYKLYLAKQGIYQQLFLEKSDYISLGFKGLSLVGFSAKFRDLVQEALSKYHFKPDELAVINALLLGQRQDISKDLIAQYSNAGAIHILAVSGLHVGIILLILSALLKPIERFKNGKFLKSLLIICILWMFAFVAGLSASVVRAVTMFTFLAIGNAFQRKKVTEFSLISSMFFLLLVKPLFLFDVGFQLSYLAVFGIIWIQPKLYKIYTPTYKIEHKIWQLITVSIAAQIGVLPLSLYYFHQFPGLFMLSNLIIIPCLGAILIGGILLIFMALLGVLPQFLASIYGFIISLMNSFVSWISQQEYFLFKDISLSFLMMIATYVLLILGIRFLIKTAPKKAIYFLVSVLFFQSVILFEKYQKNTKIELIVFHKTRKSALGLRNGGMVNIYHTIDSLEVKKINMIQGYTVGENIKPIFRNQFSDVFHFKNKDVLVIDSLGVYKVKGLKKPFIIIRNSPKLNMERLIKTMNPSHIIADGSNYKSDVKRWKSSAKKLKIPFHDTGEKGAFKY